MNTLPKGYEEVKNIEAVYINKKTGHVVITSQPDEDDAGHNCDYMGCGSLSHVIIRAKIKRFRVEEG